MGNMVLCGVVVDKKIYDEFSAKRYVVPHDFKDGNRTLWNIEQMAQMSDYKKHYPEFARECKKIVEQAAREIKQHYAATTGRKEFKVMKHDNFEGYLKDLQEIHKSASGERMELQKRTKEDIAAIRGEFEEHIEDFFSANGDRMDDGTIRLLNSGLKLNNNEIDRLVSQNVNNPTMLRLISDHCEKNKIDNQAARIYGTRAKAAGSHETNIFNQVADMIEKATSKDDLSADVWGINKGHFERLSNEAIGNMSAMAVKPGISEE